MDAIFEIHLSAKIVVNFDILSGSLLLDLMVRIN